MSPDELMDDLVEQWHEGPIDGRELHEFLGMSWEQYARWVEGRMTAEEAVAIVSERGLK